MTPATAGRGSEVDGRSQSAPEARQTSDPWSLASSFLRAAEVGGGGGAKLL